MGRQSSRLMYMGEDHKDIFFNGHYHKQMWITDKNANPTLLWEKLEDSEKPDFVFTVRDTMVAYEDGDWSPTAGQVRIAIASSDYLKIDWGDGTIEKTYGNSNIYYGHLHNYPTSDNSLYTVKIYGNVEVFNPVIWMQSAQNSCIEEIITPFPKSLCVNLGDSVAAYFMYCKSLKRVPEYLFSECKDNEYNVFYTNSVFDLSGIVELPANIFYGIKRIGSGVLGRMYDLQTINPLVFNGTEGYNLDAAFSQCNSLIHAPGELFSLYKGATANRIFYQCTSLLSASSVNNETLEELKYAFYQCSKLETIGEIVVPTLKDLSYAFAYCTSLKDVGEINCENIENMSSAFISCVSLKETPIINSNSLIYMNLTFNNCTSLEYARDIESETLLNLASAFSGCTSLREVPKIKAKELKTIASAFSGCTSLTDIPADFLSDCPNVTDVRYAFKDCSGITGNVPELWKLEQITKYDRCFAGCVNASNYNDIPNDWK